MSVFPKEGDGVVELGATCIHGASPENPVFALAQEWGLANSCATVNRIAGKYCQEDGRQIDPGLVERVWKLYKEMEANMHKRVNSASTPKGVAVSTMSCQQFVQEARPDILHKFSDPEEREQASRVLNNMFNYMRFMSGYELTHVSADLEGNYLTFPGHEAVFTGKGYNAFVDNLRMTVPQGSILFNRQVSKIIWGGVGKVNAGSAAGKAKVLCTNGEQYEADHIVVTCSLGHLKANYRQMFDPPLPVDKAGAIERMGFGRVTKLFIYYNKPFWQEGVKLAWSTDVPEIKSRWDWVKRIVGFDEQPCNPHVLGGPFAGQGAEIVDTLTDEEVARDCRDVLRKFLSDPSIPNPDLVLRSTWNTNPLYLGAYSYLSMESRVGDIGDLLRPILDNNRPVVLFAGEATHPNYYSTVHGAYLSGEREANRIKQYMLLHKL